MKGKSLLRGLFFGRLDFSVIALLLFSVLALYTCHDDMKERDYLKFLGAHTTRFKLFLAVTLSRFSFFCLCLVVMCSGLLVFIRLRGVVMSLRDFSGLLLYLPMVVLFILFFIGLGTLLGTYSQPKNNHFRLVSAWLLLVIFIPGLLIAVSENDFPDVITALKTELKKIEILATFEKNAREKGIVYDKNNIERALKEVEKFYGGDSKEMSSAEKSLRDELAGKLDRLSFLSVLFPTTFYMHTCNEVSSCGYRNYLLFYDYLIKMQYDFVGFWIDRVYRHDPSVMVSFIKKDENIFRAVSRVPRFYGWGLLMLALYDFLIFWAAYARFKKMMNPVSKTPGAFSKLSFNPQPGHKCIWRIFHKDLINQFYNGFMGVKSALAGKIKIAGKDITASGKVVFCYLVNPDKFPDDLRARDLIRFFKRLYPVTPAEIVAVKTRLGERLTGSLFMHLENEEIALVLLLMAKLSRCPVYIFRDFLVGIPMEMLDRLYDTADELLAGGGLLIDLSSLNIYSFETDEVATISYSEGEYIEKKG